MKTSQEHLFEIRDRVWAQVYASKFLELESQMRYSEAAKDAEALANEAVENIDFPVHLHETASVVAAWQQGQQSRRSDAK